MRPARGKVLVKRVETEETLPGGKIIFTESAQEAWAQWQVEVIDVGLPSICDKPKKCGRAHDYVEVWMLDQAPANTHFTHRRDDRLKPGAWCIIRHRSLVPVGNDDKRFLCNQEDILGVFQEGGAVITQTGQSNVMSMERRHELAQREIDRRANERYGDANY